MLGRVARVTPVSPCRRVVLNHLAKSARMGKIFSPLRDIPTESTHHELTKKATVDYHQMLGSLPSGLDIIHRGMAGFAEVESIATYGRFGAGKYTKRPFSLNIAEFIHKPQSCVLLSTSPDPYTVKEYMVGFQLISAKGAIASMCLPAVYIRPQTARHIDVEQFQYYQSILNAQQAPGEYTRGENIFDLAQGNNETTVVLGATKEDDWRPQFDIDLHSIVLVQGAGRILSGFTKAETVDTTTIINPFFRKRIMSIEIASTTSAESSMFLKYVDKMNERAQKLGVAKDGYRVLTLADASIMMSSLKYLETLGKYSASDKTMILQDVPAEIPIGSEELVEYALHLIEANPAKELVSTSAESLQHKL
ncbi:hypothetical protein DGG96_09930 [Legionella qingyii]|uniref:Uncharacterized protein n=1 Tax=Legionella qingyii TaxID=2184757 RepID=A0A317U3L8_9GAMM|nr:hypothetical protein [Legionella qingyii]PWY55825.1 hypothetical protein DGG96_09930 [Legionella qingyii]RUR23080.1 hypothetical protein ELY20_08040 [Legionella qingyii]RUR26926.1 hypothetical protein ELY16_06745 [Legionella qingyii]